MGKTSVSVQSIDSFGEVAAEDDAVADYFVTTDAHKRIADGDALLVLGRKGSGKTALVRNFSETQGNTHLSTSVTFRSYPWSLHAQRVDAGAAATEAYTSSWEFLLAIEVAKLALRRAGNSTSAPAKVLRTFFKSNYSSEQPDSADILRPEKMALSGTLEPEVFGVKLGSLAWTRDRGDFGLKSEVSAVASALFAASIEVLQKDLRSRPLLIHLDELDQGLDVFDDQRRKMITGLVLAARNIRSRYSDAGRQIRPVVYLRTDLWDQLLFSDKNKITQTNAVRIEWSIEELQKLIERRASVRIGQQVAWDDLEDGELMRGSQQKWKHIATRTYLRPRDVIKFCNEVLKNAKNRGLKAFRFINDDVNQAREPYSNYLKAELDDEILPHWPNWHVALDALSAIETITFLADDFMDKYEARRNSDCPTASEAMERLFDFSVIGWERRFHSGGSSWAFKYDSSDVRWDQTASRFKTHPGLKEYLRLKEERR